MVQFNLLPDVKKDYIKAKRLRRNITMVSFLVTAVFVGLTILLFVFVRFAQVKNIDDLTADIKRDTAQIQASENLDRKLTVQNQLSLLTPLHEQKPETSRVLEYVRFFSPETTELTKLELDTINNTLSLTGKISTLAEANRLVENIKAVQYAVYEPGSQPPEVVDQPLYMITNSEVTSDGEEARFEIDIEYQPEIFDNTTEIVMKLLGAQISTDQQAEDDAQEEQQ